MEAGIVRGGRTLLALLTAVALVASMLWLLGGTAEAAHIDATGPLQSNCVEFQAGDTGTESPSSFPGVDITLVSWDDSQDPHTVDFTISGLASNEFVDISVKSGTTVQEAGPYGNGSHSFSNGLQNAISHIRLCVFEDEEETTTTSTTSTTVPEETTTVPEETTTVPEETTTTVEETTTTVEVLETTLTAPESSTTTEEVLAEELPFTGIESEALVFLAAALTLLGSLVVMSARRAQD